jgi:hypothetical protein
MLVTTAARIIAEIKGQKRRPSKKAETIKSARKNHKIILPEVLSCIATPIQYKEFLSSRMAVTHAWPKPDKSAMD